MYQSDFYENILNSITSAVISLNPEGIVTSFNPMASKIMGLPANAVIGKKFSELILSLEGADEFFDMIIDAVYDASISHQRTVEASFGGRHYYLSLKTTYLQEERDGKLVKAGILAVFEDLSEVRELHLKELRLKKELEAKHEELRNAFLEIEASNQQLRATSKRIYALRLGAATFALFLMATIGVYVWKAGLLVDEEKLVVDAKQMMLPVMSQNTPTMVVTPKRINSSISIPGRLAPKRRVDIFSPLDSKVAEIHCQYGQRVTGGQTLIELDMEPTRIEQRRARVELIKARKRLKALEDLSSNVAVSRARRALEQTKTDMEVSKDKLSKSAFLLKRGLIPFSEHEAAKKTYQNQQLNVQSAEQDLNIILADTKINREAARLELANSRVKLKQLAEIIRQSKVKAPVSGVVMWPGRGRRVLNRQSSPILAKGVAVKQGGYLLTIGDLNGFKIVGNVDEVDIVRIRTGQAVTIVGDAFPGLKLEGKITEVSPQAIGDTLRQGHPRFEVAAVVDNLTDAQRKKLRLGMSARSRIVVYDKPNALVVPIHAVEARSGRPQILVKDQKTGEPRLVDVVTGVTTQSTVEILDGIKAGDEIILSPRKDPPG